MAEHISMYTYSRGGGGGGGVESAHEYLGGSGAHTQTWVASYTAIYLL